MSFEPFPFLKGKTYLYSQTKTTPKSYKVGFLIYGEIEIIKSPQQDRNLEYRNEKAQNGSLDYTVKPIKEIDLTKWYLSEDEAKIKVLDAISDNRFDFRTIEGISRNLGIPKDVTSKIITKNKKFIRKCWAKDKQGRDLYTLASRRVKLRELLAVMQTFFGKSFQ